MENEPDLAYGEAHHAAGIPEASGSDNASQEEDVSVSVHPESSPEVQDTAGAGGSAPRARAAAVAAAAAARAAAAAAAAAAGGELSAPPAAQRPSRQAQGLLPAPPSDAPDPEVLKLIGAWIGMQRDLQVSRRHPRDRVADAVTAEALTYEKVVLADSSTFEGQLRGDDRHGWGKFTWDDGGTYEGQFDGNDMHGQGTYRWADGSLYVGVWSRNQMGPSGKMTWTDGREYSGEFADGRKHGEGKIVWPDGRAYHGQWRSGKQHGFGVTVHSSGKERRSQWENGILVRWVEDQETFDMGKDQEAEARRQLLAQR